MIARWVKKLHMYTGLLNMSILLVFGIAGLLATIDPGPARRWQPVKQAAPSDAARPAPPRRPPGELREFRVPPNVSDYDAALAAYQFLRLPLADRPVESAVRRDADGNVAFDLYSMNGIRHITLLENEGRMRVDYRRNILPRFVDNLHSTTLIAGPADLRVRMWSWYNEFAIWSLIFMALSGVWLWLASRPAYRWGRISFAAGSGIFLVLFALSR